MNVPIGSRNRQSSVRTGSIIATPAVVSVRAPVAPTNRIDVPAALFAIDAAVERFVVAAGVTVVILN
jgi:hypothetical protein